MADNENHNEKIGGHRTSVEMAVENRKIVPFDRRGCGSLVSAYETDTSAFVSMLPGIVPMFSDVVYLSRCTFDLHSQQNTTASVPLLVSESRVKKDRR